MLHLRTLLAETLRVLRRELSLCAGRRRLGLAIVGRAGEDGTVLGAAHAFQRATDWHERRPPLGIRAASPSV